MSDDNDAKQPRCAFTGEDRCWLRVQGQHNELLDQQGTMLEELRQQMDDLRGVGRSLKELLDQEKEYRGAFLDILQGKAPKGYVPLWTHIVTVGLAAGMANLEALTKLAQHFFGL